MSKTIIYTDLSGVLTAFIIQFFILLITLALFHGLRFKFPKIYFPKWFKNAGFKQVVESKINSLTSGNRQQVDLQTDQLNERDKVENQAQHVQEKILKEKSNETLSPKNLKIFALIKTIDRNELLNLIGFDAYFFLLFLEMICKFFVVSCFFSIVTMIVNYFADSIDKSDSLSSNTSNSTVNDNLLSLSTLTMSNIPSNSRLFYYHTVVTYFLSIIACYFLYQYYTHYIDLKQSWMQSDDYQKLFHNRMLLITDNIKSRQDSFRFRAYLGTLGIETIPQSIKIGRNTNNLPELLQKHLDTIGKFEQVLVKYVQEGADPGKRPVHREGAILGVFGGNQVDSIQFYRMELDRLEKEIYSYRATLENEFETDYSCFLSFGSVQERCMAFNELSKKRVLPKQCPDFSDILWENIGVSPIIKKSRKTTAILITTGLIIGWVFLQSAIAALSGTLITSSGLPSSTIVFLQSIVTPLINVILNILLPIFLRIIARLQCVTSQTGVERSATYKFFTFQVYQYVIQLAAQVIFTFVANLIKGKGFGDIHVLVNALGIAFVSQSTYFITFIVTGLSGFGITMLQIAPLIVNPFMKRFLATTPRDREKLKEIQEFNYMESYGFIMMVYLLTISYSVVAPLIVPFATIVLTLRYSTLKYLLIFVYKSKIETGGLWVDKVFNMTITCLIIFQLSTCGAVIVLSRGSSTTGSICSGLLLCLCGFTLSFWAFVWFLKRKRAEEMVVKSEETSIMSESYYRAHSVCHPALCTSIPRIQVVPEHQQKVNELYQPAYSNIMDYIHQSTTDEIRWKQVEELEKERNVQREFMEEKENQGWLLLSTRAHTTPILIENRKHSSIFALS